MIFQTQQMQIVFGSLLFLLPVELFCYYYVLKKLTVTVGANHNQLSKKVPIPIEITVHNPTWIPILECTLVLTMKNGFYEEEKREQIKLPILAKKGQVLTTSITSSYAGCIEVSVKQLALWDLLRIKKLKKEVQAHSEYIILPEVVEDIEVDKNAYVTGQTEVEESSQKGNDFSEVNNIREYHPGDSLKDIHWKLSVKQGSLMVKEHVSMSSMQLIILMELEDNGRFQLDHMLDVVYSIGRQLLSEHMNFTLCYFGKRQGRMVTAPVINEDGLLDAFVQLMYECTYPLGSHLGKEHIAYESDQITCLLWAYVGEKENGEAQVIYEEDMVHLVLTEV